MYKRAEYQTIKERLEEPRKFIQVVMGPRQVGKSTVVKQVLEDISIPFRFFSADNVPASDSGWVSNCWAAVRSLKASKGHDCIILVIDEIQKIQKKAPFLISMGVSDINTIPPVDEQSRRRCRVSDV